jgi:hypothetical protein
MRHQRILVSVFTSKPTSFMASNRSSVFSFSNETYSAYLILNDICIRIQKFNKVNDTIKDHFGKCTTTKTKLLLKELALWQ